jgi:hypothetical protein
MTSKRKVVGRVAVGVRTKGKQKEEQQRKKAKIKERKKDDEGDVDMDGEEGKSAPIVQDKKAGKKDDGTTESPFMIKIPREMVVRIHIFPPFFLSYI